MFKLFPALFISIAVFATGCSISPVRYVVAAAAPAPAETTTVVTPTVVYVEQPLFYSPVIGIAAGYMLWRGLSGGRHGGHHRR
jgi:multidrug efflux pump subunit AcrA (membrane-fusion protein)